MQRFVKYLVENGYEEKYTAYADQRWEKGLEQVRFFLDHNLDTVISIAISNFLLIMDVINDGIEPDWLVPQMRRKLYIALQKEIPKEFELVTQMVKEVRDFIDVNEQKLDDLTYNFLEQLIVDKE